MKGKSWNRNNFWRKPIRQGLISWNRDLNQWIVYSIENRQHQACCIQYSRYQPLYTTYRPWYRLEGSATKKSDIKLISLISRYLIRKALIHYESNIQYLEPFESAILIESLKYRQHRQYDSDIIRSMLTDA